MECYECYESWNGDHEGIIDSPFNGYLSIIPLGAIIAFIEVSNSPKWLILEPTIEYYRRLLRTQVVFNNYIALYIGDLSLGPGNYSTI